MTDATSAYVWVRCPNGHGTPGQQHFDYCGVCPECAAVLGEVGSPLAMLEDRPIFEGDILYGLDGTKFSASPTGHRDYKMAMIDLATVRGNTWHQWLTNTHWKGQQILFWRVEDIPAPQDRTLGSRLRAQLDARKARSVSARRLKAPSRTRRQNGSN